MRKSVIVVACLLAACGVTESNVYEQRLPDRSDTDALLNIRDALKPDDQEAWSRLVLQMNMPMASKIEAKTVGEAVTRWKARNSCMERYSSAKRPAMTTPDDVEAYNRMTLAYNECLKMPV